MNLCILLECNFKTVTTFTLPNTPKVHRSFLALSIQIKIKNKFYGFEKKNHH